MATIAASKITDLGLASSPSTCTNAGDDFANNGVYNGVYNNNLNINAKTIIYGVFDKIYMDDLNEKLFAIIGK